MKLSLLVGATAGVFVQVASGNPALAVAAGVMVFVLFLWMFAGELEQEPEQ